MVERKTWEEFRACKMLWWINMILHTFGWAIVTNVETDGTVRECYPARVKFRGFDDSNNTEGYIGVSKFMMENGKELYNEARGDI